MRCGVPRPCPLDSRRIRCSSPARLDSPSSSGEPGLEKGPPACPWRRSRPRDEPRRADRGSAALRHRADRGRRPRLHRARHLREVAGARRAADDRGGLRTLLRPSGARRRLRARGGRGDRADPEPRGGDAARRLSSHEHHPELHGAPLPAAHGDGGDRVLRPALGLPAVDPVSRRAGRATPLGGDRRRVLRGADRHSAVVGSRALGGGAVDRRGARRCVLLGADPHCSPGATAPARSSSTPRWLRRSARRRWLCSTGPGRAGSRAGSPSC